MGEVTINALDGVSFSVEEGELCMVVGPSGAGKTTVLNILGGIDACNDGKVRVGGDLINQFNEIFLSHLFHLFSPCSLPAALCL